MITKKQKEQWVVDLRSGRFIQGRSNLFSSRRYTDVHGSFCCLGVLATQFCSTERLESKYFQDEVGLEGLLGPYDSDDVFAAVSLQRQLADLNDRKEFTFEEIADWIEQNVEAVDE